MTAITVRKGRQLLVRYRVAAPPRAAFPRRPSVVSTLSARSLLAALLAAVVTTGPAAPSAAAQPPESAGPGAESLRARLASGDAQGALDAVLSLVKAGKDDVERVLVGCEAAIN